MAKRLFLLHIGPQPVDVSAMTETLRLGGVAVLDAPDAVLAHAATEILRTHKQHGLKRKQVEGSWATLCRRARKAKADCFVSMPVFFDASPEQAALALDGLADFTVVLVVTSGFDLEPPAAWLRLAKDGRAHVLPAHLTDEQLAVQVARIALVEEEARLQKGLARISRRRRKVGRTLAA
jgi:hypothetical protein